MDELATTDQSVAALGQRRLRRMSQPTASRLALHITPPAVSAYTTPAAVAPGESRARTSKAVRTPITPPILARVASSTASLPGQIVGYERRKRLLDLVICLLILPVALPVLAVCGIAVRLESSGPVFSVQTYVGRGGRRFRAYLLRATRSVSETERERAGRSRKQDVASVGDVERADDADLTRVGRVIRRMTLEDLPLIFSVLRGDMSLVGPRPLPDGLHENRLWHTARLEVQPGIVSPSWVLERDDLGFDESLRLEIGYTATRTIARDAQTLLHAVRFIVRRRGELARRTESASFPSLTAPAQAPRATGAMPGATPWVAPDIGARPTAPAEAAAPRTLSRYWRVRSVLLATFDSAAILTAIVLSYYIRFDLMQFVGGPAGSTALLLTYVESSMLLAAMWWYGLWRSGAYRCEVRGLSVPVVRLGTIAMTGAYALVGLMAVGFLYRDLLLSRQVYLVGAVLATAAVAGVRAVFARIDAYVAARGDVSGRVVIVGSNASAYEFADTLRREAPSMQVVGFVSEAESGGLDNRAVLGHVLEIERLHRQHGFDTLVLASPRLSAAAMECDNESWVHLLNFCEEREISLYMVSGSFSAAVTAREVTSFSGRPLIRLKDASLHPLYALVKRVLDVVCALTVLICGLPVWLIIAALVKLTSPGPLLFIQWRAGQHGQPFRMYKFRSMTADAEDQLASLVDFSSLKEPVFKLRNDPRVTSIGAWMRRTGLDEIPQLYNVLRGEMSIVGPRPEESRLVECYTPSQRRRLKAKPGITGYQQIKNRGATSLADRVKYDLVYLKHQSLALDLYIMCRTVVVLIRGTGITH
jgi:exopolysaccharide biosynthesis polyprenyl glycosylphosphotransferase